VGAFAFAGADVASTGFMSTGEENKRIANNQAENIFIANYDEHCKRILSKEPGKMGFMLGSLLTDGTAENEFIHLKESICIQQSYIIIGRLFHRSPQTI
jgi:hypothetical protein